MKFDEVNSTTKYDSKQNRKAGRELTYLHHRNKRFMHRAVAKIYHMQVLMQIVHTTEDTQLTCSRDRAYEQQTTLEHASLVIIPKLLLYNT